MTQSEFVLKCLKQGGVWTVEHLCHDYEEYMDRSCTATSISARCRELRRMGHPVRLVRIGNRGKLFGYTLEKEDKR